MVKKCEDLIKEAQDALHKYQPNQRNHKDREMLENETFRLHMLIDIIRDHKDDSNLQYVTLEYKTSKAKIAKLIEKLIDDEDVITTMPTTMPTKMTTTPPSTTMPTEPTKSTTTGINNVGDGRDDLIKKYDQLIQQAKDALKKHPSNTKNQKDHEKIEGEIYQMEQLKEIVHFHKDDSNLQWDNLQYQTQKKKLEEMIKKLEQDDNVPTTTTTGASDIIANEFDKDYMIERCDVVLKRAQHAMDTHKQTEENKPIMDKLLKCCIGLTQLKSSIRLSKSEANLQMEELYLETYEKMVPDLIKKLDNPKTIATTNDDDGEKVINESKRLIEQAELLRQQHHAISYQQYKQLGDQSDILRHLIAEAKMAEDKNEFDKIINELRKQNEKMRELLP